MKKTFAIFLILSGTFTVTGCDTTSAKNERRERFFEMCMEHGGSYQIDGWSGEPECLNASGNGDVNIEVDN